MYRLTTCQKSIICFIVQTTLTEQCTRPPGQYIVT